MHLASYKKIEFMVRFYEKFFTEDNGFIKVLDIGSCGVGRCYRDIFTDSKYKYVGLDMVKGPNVDIVPKNIYQWDEIEDETFDVVISGQAFEHIEYPWLTIKEIARILKPSGFCFIIAPNAGIEHKAPRDCYRYYADGLLALAKWADMKVHHTSVGGVPETDNVTDWVSEWNDACLVAQKEPFDNIEKEPFEKEIRVPVHGAEAYNLFSECIKSACNQFVDKRPFVLFGAGWIGDIVLEVLGSDHVSFFIDNSSEKIGTERKGKKVISFQDYVKYSDQYNCLVTASKSASLSIRRSLQKEGIDCQILYEA